MKNAQQKVSNLAVNIGLGTKHLTFLLLRSHYVLHLEKIEDCFQGL